MIMVYNCTRYAETGYLEFQGWMMLAVAKGHPCLLKALQRQKKRHSDS